jgi:uncharacterized protein YndB with AHSA1/START domain
MENRIEAPVAKAQLLIRKPVAEVFEALLDPAITSRFWFSISWSITPRMRSSKDGPHIEPRDPRRPGD